MDRAAIEELFDYVGFAWGQTVETVSKVGEPVVFKPAPGSGWPALRDCFGHMLWAYDIWLARLEGRPKPDFEPSAVKSFAEIEAYSRAVRGHFQAYLDSLSDDELFADRDVDCGTDGPFRYTPAEILANLVLHERGHHGDVTTLLYQHSVPEDVWPWLDYRGFLNARRGYPLD